LIGVLLAGRASAEEPASAPTSDEAEKKTAPSAVQAEPLVLPETLPADAPRSHALDTYIPEPTVPLTIDEPAHHKSRVPSYLLVGAFVAAFAAGTLWALAATEDNRYKNTPAGPGRDAMLNTANDELLAAQICGIVALAAVGTATVWLAF
jgi:hypothetical protein